MKVRKYIVLSLSISLIFLIIFSTVRIFSEKTDTYIKTDAELLLKNQALVKDIILYAENQNEIFNPERKKDFSLSEEKTIYEVWSSLLNYLIWLDTVKNKYMKQGFRSFLGDKKELCYNYSISYLAFQTQFLNAYKFVKMVQDNYLFEVILDEKDAKWNIPKNSLSKIKFNTLNIVDMTHLLASMECYKIIDALINKIGLNEDSLMNNISTLIQENEKEIKRYVNLNYSKRTFKNGWDIVKTSTFKTWFPLQKNVAVMLGKTKLKRLNSHLIQDEQLRQFKESLQPGDIILERKNWYLSNIGLPGFWPHAELYIGDINELERYFKDSKEVTDWINKTDPDSSDFIDFLKRRYSKKFALYNSKSSDGTFPVIIEAVGTGVRFSTMKEANSCDYLSAIRPNTGKLSKAMAIDRAFSFVGKPYDFDFDFASNQKLVCTELVYKSYKGIDNRSNLPLETIEVLGRPTLPANLIADCSIKNPEYFSFIAFIDAQEDTQKSFFSDYENFKKSVERPKWDFLLE